MARAPLMTFAFAFLPAALCLGIDYASTNNEDNNTEMGFHLAFAGDPSSSMSISWTTPTLPPGYTPTCFYGLHASQLDDHAVGSTSSYFISFQHSVVLSGLTSNSRYFYKCGGAQNQAQKTFSFQTAPVPQKAAAEPFAVAMFGDMGVTNSNATIKQLVSFRSSYDFIVHLGDMSYADDITWVGRNPKYEQVQDKFFESIEPLAASTAYHVLPGNHDASCHAVWNLGCDARLENFSAYRTRWRMPWRESGGKENMWYSFDYGLAHFVFISTESDYPGAPPMGMSRTPGPFGDQLSWLRSDLEQAQKNRKSRPWIIVLGHRPFYTSAKIDWPPWVRANIQKVFEPIFAEFKVDLYMSAHVHAYERLTGIYNGAVNFSATSYITNGAAGNKEGHQHLSGNAPKYVSHRNSQDFGFGLLSVHNVTALSWQFIRSEDGGIDDHAWITKA